MNRSNQSEFAIDLSKYVLRPNAEVSKVEDILGLTYPTRPLSIDFNKWHNYQALLTDPKLRDDLDLSLWSTISRSQARVAQTHPSGKLVVSYWDGWSSARKRPESERFKDRIHENIHAAVIQADFDWYQRLFSLDNSALVAERHALLAFHEGLAYWGENYVSLIDGGWDIPELLQDLHKTFVKPLGVTELHFNHNPSVRLLEIAGHSFVFEAIKILGTQNLEPREGFNFLLHHPPTELDEIFRPRQFLTRVGFSGSAGLH